MTETQTGYTTQDVRTLTSAQLVEEALQSADSAGYYGAMAELGRYGEFTEARDRRNATFAEIVRRLAAAERLAEAVEPLRYLVAEYSGYRDDYCMWFYGDAGTGITLGELRQIVTLADWQGKEALS